MDKKELAKFAVKKILKDFNPSTNPSNTLRLKP